MITLVLGGGRSGKSDFAEALASETGKSIAYIATAVPFDDEMKQRIEKHQRKRPDNWITIEMYHELNIKAESSFANYDCILLDSIGMMVNNIMYDCEIETKEKENFRRAEEMAIESIEGLVQYAMEYHKELVLVSEEVGMGVVPENYLTRCYRDILGTVNQAAARRANRVFMVVAGIQIQIK